MDEDQGKEESFYFLKEAITNWEKLLLAFSIRRGAEAHQMLLSSAII
jgi:hypothetical protein